MVAAFASGGVAVAYGQPRRLVGQGSVFTLSDWEERFARLPDQAVPYQQAIDAIRASGVARVGLVMEGTCGSTSSRSRCRTSSSWPWSR